VVTTGSPSREQNLTQETRPGCPLGEESLSQLVKAIFLGPSWEGKGGRGSFWAEVCEGTGAKKLGKDTRSDFLSIGSTGSTEGKVGLAKERLGKQKKKGRAEAGTTGLEQVGQVVSKERLGKATNLELESTWNLLSFCRSFPPFSY